MGLAKYVHIARINFAAKTAYIGDVLLGSAFYALILYIFVQLWKVLGPSPGVLPEGFSQKELVWYLAASEAIMLGKAPIASEVSDEVKSGAIAYALGRPYSYLGFKLATYWGDTSLRMMVNVVIGAAVALAAVGAIPLSPARLLMWGAAVALALTLNFFMVMCLSLSAFWVEDTGPFFWIYSKVLFVLGGLFVPIDFYPESLRRAAAVSPFNLVLYAPSKLLVAFDAATFGQTVMMQLVWVVILGALAAGLYAMGVRRLNVNGG